MPDTAPVLEVAAPVNDESDDGPVDAECEDEPELDGSADASHGVAPSAAPMPSATANAPTRPLYLVYPIVVSFPAAPPVDAWDIAHSERSASSLPKPRHIQSPKIS